MEKRDSTIKKIKAVIIGAGFAGITAMQKLAKNPHFEVTIVAPNNHFEYYPGLYRILSTYIPFEVFVPTRYLVPKNVIWIKSKAESFDTVTQTVILSNGEHISYNRLIIATGTQATDFGISGVNEYAHYVTSLTHMLEAKKVLQEMFKTHVESKNKNPFSIIVAGAGPTGVELSGELTEMTKRLSVEYSYPQSHIQIKVIQRDQTVLPQLPEKVQKSAMRRLQKIGVQVLLGYTIKTVHEGTVETDTGNIPYDMLFWSAGATQSALIHKHLDFVLSPRKKVIVDNQFRSEGHTDVYVLGDNAETQFSGLAQIAEQDGAHIADLFISEVNHRTLPVYAPRNPIYVIPIGNYFGILGISGKIFTGLLPWLLRYLVDARFFFFALKFKDFLHLSLNRKLK
jgi:NADH dehydrogenase